MTKDDAIKAIEGLQYVQDGVLLIEFQYYNQALQDAIEAIRALPDAGWRDIDDAMIDRAETANRIAPIDDRASVFLNHRVAIRAALEAAFTQPQPPEKGYSGDITIANFTDLSE